jgi:DNA-binding CsgD family transcriptional regulator
MLRAIIATASYWAWIFLLYWSSALTASFVDPQITLYVKGAAFFGSAVSLFCSFLLNKREKATTDQANTNLSYSRKRFQAVVAIICCPLAPLTTLLLYFGIDLPFALDAVLWFLAGFGAAILLIQIGRSQLYEGVENSHLVAFVAIFISCLVGIFTTMLPTHSTVSVLILIVLPWVTFWASGYASKRSEESYRVLEQKQDKSQAPVAQPITDLDERMLRRYFVRFFFQLCFYSVVFSFALVISLQTEIGNVSISFVWFGCFLAGCFIMVYSMWLNRYFSIEMVQWILLAAAAISLFLLSLAADSVITRFACCSILMFTFTAYDMLSLSQLFSLISVYRLRFLRYFTLGRFGNAIGMFIGWVLACAAQYIATFTDNALPLQVFSFIAMIVLSVLIVLSSYDRMKGTSLPTTLSKPSSANSDTASGLWKNSCAKLETEYALTARECEVFELYARGRDCSYVSEALYVSEHTVKSHVYHIYQKMDIHSQQELISIVEKRTRDIKGTLNS